MAGGKDGEATRRCHPRCGYQGGWWCCCCSDFFVLDFVAVAVAAAVAASNVRPIYRSNTKVIDLAGVKTCLFLSYKLEVVQVTAK